MQKPIVRRRARAFLRGLRAGRKAYWKYVVGYNRDYFDGDSLDPREEALEYIERVAYAHPSYALGFVLGMEKAALAEEGAVPEWYDRFRMGVMFALEGSDIVRDRLWYRLVAL